MKQSQINNCPIVYYTKKVNDSAEWILFLHAAFVDCRMFNKQIDFFAKSYVQTKKSMI